VSSNFYTTIKTSAKIVRDVCNRKTSACVTALSIWGLGEGSYDFKAIATGFVVSTLCMVRAHAVTLVWLECDETFTSLEVHGPPTVVQMHNTYKIDAENSKVGEVTNAGTKWYSAVLGETSVRWDDGVLITTIDRRTLTIISVDKINTRFTNSSEGQCQKSDGPRERQF
jgi:hypothetical protein